MAEYLLIAKSKRTAKQFCDILDSFISKFTTEDTNDPQKANQCDRIAPQFQTFLLSDVDKRICHKPEILE